MQMSTSDSFDDDELAGDTRKRVFPAGRPASSQMVHLTSTLKVLLTDFCGYKRYVYLFV